MQLFADILAPKNNKAKCFKRKAAQFAFVRKTCAYNVDEIDLMDAKTKLSEQLFGVHEHQ